MFRIRRKLLTFLAFLIFSSLIYSFAICEQLTWKNLYKVRNISNINWKPDSTEIAFNLSDRGTGMGAVCVVKASGGPVKKIYESKTGSTLIEKPWSKDGRRLYFTQGNSIGEIHIGTKTVRMLVKFSGHHKGYIPQVYYGGLTPRLSPDESRLTFSWQSEIYIADIIRGGLTQITNDYPDGWHNFDPHWSPDGKHLFFTAVDTHAQKPFLFLTYEKIMAAKKGLIGLSEVKIGVVSAEGGEPVWLAPDMDSKYSLRGGSNALWSPDGSQILINKVSLDHTKREIIIANPTTGQARVIYTEKVTHWISPMAIWVRFSPDGKKILFTSEKTGWNHIYIMDAGGGEPQQLTKGSFTVTSNQVYEGSEVIPNWSIDGSRIYFPSNEGDTAQRHIYVVPSSGGERTRLTSIAGVNSHMALSPDEKKIAFFHSDLYHPQELHVMDNAPASKSVQLTDSYLPEELKNMAWVEKEVVYYKNTKDQTKIAALLYKPVDFQKNKKYPVVIFAHGAGYTQNVYKGKWGERFLFNEYLAQQGYVVLGPDFRGSAGYGAKFRLDVFDKLGFIDLDDVLSGIEYLKTLGWIDEDRIGIWGHSYGGFMVCMAMFRAPDVFSVGVSGAPVTDWERFFYLAPGYNEEHFGFPWINPEGTRKCSPIHYVKNLKNPFLLLSGIQDTMHLDAEVLVLELLKHRKRFDVIFYPQDAHGLSIPTTTEDKWRRKFEFLDNHLNK